MAEGRRGNEEFDVNSYRNQYGDLRAAYGDDLISYYLHYIDYGRSEGRQGSGYTGPAAPSDPGTPSTPGGSRLTVYEGRDYASVYDYDYYISHNGDVAAAFGGDQAATLRQFVLYGMAEGRQGSENFDVNSYKNEYAGPAGRLRRRLGVLLPALCGLRRRRGPSRHRLQSADGRRGQSGRGGLLRRL